MAEGIIDMQDMDTIFAVTDAFGIHRESVSVELSKEDPGSIQKSSGGGIDITVPESVAIQEFSTRLQAELEAMGYIAVEEEDEED